MSERWQDDEVGLKAYERERNEIERQTDALVLKTVTSLLLAAEEVTARLRRDTDSILEDFRRNRRGFAHELSLAGATRERMRQDAESESRRILDDARSEAERIRRAARADPGSLLDYVPDLEERVRALETQILDMLGATRGGTAPARSSESGESAGVASSSAALGSLATGTTGVAPDEPLTATWPVADPEPPTHTPDPPASTSQSQSYSPSVLPETFPSAPSDAAVSHDPYMPETSTPISHSSSPVPIDAESPLGSPASGSTLHAVTPATTGAHDDGDEFSLIGSGDAASTPSSSPITHPPSTMSAAATTEHATELGSDDTADATSSSAFTVDRPEAPTSDIDSTVTVATATHAPSSSSTSVGSSAVSSSPVETPDGAASVGTDERRPLQLVFDGVPGYQQAAAIERAVGDLAEDGDVEIIEFEQGQLVLRVEASNPRSLADRLVTKPPLPMRLVASGRDSATFQLTPG